MRRRGVLSPRVARRDRKEYGLLFPETVGERAVIPGELTEIVAAMERIWLARRKESDDDE